MKINKKKLFFVVIVPILIIIAGLIIFLVNKNKKTDDSDNLIEDTINESNTYENITEEIDENNVLNTDKNETEIKEDSNIEEVKKTIGAEGDTNIYQVQTEADGRKTLSVKSNVRFKTAFAGMIKKNTPKKEEVDDIFNKYYPSKRGIWVEENSRNKFLDMVNSGTNKYSIDSNGYLKIENKNSQSEIDKKIEKAINGNKTVIIDVSSICYIVDDKTGNIQDYNFEKIDEYQTHEYFEDDNSLIIFINENKENQLTKNEIIKNVVELF